MKKTIVKANFTDTGVPFKRQWSFCVGAGRANEGLRADWQCQLKEAVEQCGFQYIRFHGLFHDDMFVYRVIDGKEVFSFQYIDSLFDSLLHIGIRPFVELSFCPKDLASGSETQFWWKCNITPPTDFTKWGGLWSAPPGIGWSATESTRYRNGTLRSGTSRICITHSGRAQSAVFRAVQSLRGGAEARGQPFAGRRPATSNFVRICDSAARRRIRPST